MDQIFITALTTEAVIGIYDWEREVKQRLEVDLEVWKDLQAAAKSDAIEDTLNTRKPVAMAKTILENIRVLAVGQEREDKFGKGEKPASADLITLEVTPEDAEKLGLAMSEGKLLLALRTYGDMEDVLTEGIDTSTLLTSYSPGSVNGGSKNHPLYGSGDKRKRSYLCEIPWEWERKEGEMSRW